MTTIGVIGLGSMGKRRVRDLQSLGCVLAGFDINPKRNEECSSLFNIETLNSERDFFAKKFDAVIISVPPDQHQYYYDKCFDYSLPFFSEANIFTPKASWFTDMEEKSGIKTYPSATWKFHPIFNEIKKCVNESTVQNVNSVFYHYGGYLPSWHPWENYWDFYAGQRKTSAAREMVPFELGWLVDVFGNVKAVHCHKGRMATWKTDMDDSYYLNLLFENDVYATQIIELHQTDPFRIGRISFQDSSLQFNMVSTELINYNLKTGTFKKIAIPGLRVMTGFNLEQIYYDEIKCFLKAVVDNTPYVKKWEEDRHLSDVLFAAEKSAREKEWIEIHSIADEYEGFDWE